MEETIDILKVFNLTTPATIEYYAEYDISTGSVTRVGPKHALQTAEHKILIEEETAIGILNGAIKIGSCFVDTIENKFFLSEIKSAVKIDDLLHRIVESKWANFEYADVFLTYNKKNKSVKIELSEEFYGTKKIPKKFHPLNKRRVHWNGDTLMNFHVTAYNDPTILYEIFSVSVNELIENSMIVNLNDTPPDDFSIFTRRIFKNYSILIK